MLNVDALKLIYVALGGNADTVANVTLTADMLAEIAKVIPTALAVLPAVETPADDGKVLTVVSGEWAAAALPASDSVPTI